MTSTVENETLGFLVINKLLFFVICIKLLTIYIFMLSILGDGGYKLKPFLMTPFRNPKDAAERCFNRKHTSARNVVERCFGVLKNRFRCILGSRGLHYGPEKATQIINACCSLHNMCIEYNCVTEREVIEGGMESTLDEDGGGDAVDSRALAIRRNIAINL